jgi:hypothetical protein
MSQFDFTTVVTLHTLKYHSTTCPCWDVVGLDPFPFRHPSQECFRLINERGVAYKNGTANQQELLHLLQANGYKPTSNGACNIQHPFENWALRFEKCFSQVYTREA